MILKIYWSPLAVEKLGYIFEYISIDNITAAQKMVDKIFKKVETLSKYPERGRKVPETNRLEIREIFENGYRIIYRLDSKRVVVLTIRNFKQLLDDKDL